MPQILKTFKVSRLLILHKHIPIKNPLFSKILISQLFHTTRIFWKSRYYYCNIAYLLIHTGKVTISMVSAQGVANVSVSLAITDSPGL